MKKFPFGLLLIIAIATLLLTWEQTLWIALINLGTSIITFVAIYASTLSLRLLYDVLIILAYKNYRGRDDFPELLYRYWSFWTVFWRLSFFISFGVWIVSIANLVYSKIMSNSSDWWLATPLLSFRFFVISSLSYFFVVSKAWRAESELLKLRNFMQGKLEP